MDISYCLPPTLPRQKNQTRVCGEVNVSISHHLLAKSPLSAVKRIYSHRNALAECSMFLQGLSPEVERVTVPSTAMGAERALTEEGSAAIGSNLAAELLGR